MLIKIWENYKLKQVKNSTKTIFHINKWKKYMFYAKLDQSNRQQNSHILDKYIITN
jgi:hypothetical protein